MGDASWTIGRLVKTLLKEAIDAGIRGQCEVEVFSYGQIPLAYSARCFTARAENRPKDDCRYCCISYPNGLKMNSREGQKVFVLNGVQTMSGYCYNLINDIQDMKNAGVDIVRLSPESLATLSLIDDFKAQLTEPKRYPLDNTIDCNGYWHQIAGMAVAG